MSDDHKVRENQGAMNGMTKPSGEHVLSHPPLDFVASPTLSGRAPWYHNDSTRSGAAFLIGVAGGTASGKTSVCRAIVEKLNIPWVQILSMDSFYNILNDEQKALAAAEEYNFDHPDAFDWRLIESTLKQIKKGLAVQIPTYDFTTHSRTSEINTMYGADVVLFEGILTLCKPEIRELCDLKIFVHTDDDLRLMRRIRRDIQDRGRTLESVLVQYEKTVKPSYNLFCHPTQAHADVIIPRGRENTAAINLLATHVRSQLAARGVHPTNENPSERIRFTPRTEGPTRNLFILDDADVKRARKLLFNESISDAQLVEVIKILSEKTIEKALDLFRTVHNLDDKPLLPVMNVNGGLIFLPALQKICSGDLGCGTIQITQRIGEHPRFHHCGLPVTISEHRVLLLDPFVNSGNRARMAFQVLLDHSVPPQNICFVTLMTSQPGISSLANFLVPGTVVAASLVATDAVTRRLDIPRVEDIVEIFLRHCRIEYNHEGSSDDGGVSVISEFFSKNPASPHSLRKYFGRKNSIDII